MFDKNKFAQILKNITETYDSQREFAQKSKINRTYLSQYMNMKLEEPPKPKILEKLANASNGIATYEQLMIICGYINYGKNTTPIQDVVAYITTKHSQDLEIAFKNLLNLNLTNLELQNVSKAYYNCCKYIINKYYDNTIIKKKISSFTSNLSEREIKGFNCLYIFLIKRLHEYSHVPRKKDELYSLDNHLILPYEDSDVNECIDIIDGTSNYFTIKIKGYINNNSSQTSNNFHMVPVYGTIAAGQPNWAEECIEDYLPIAPELMNIVEPEECFFLRVNGESMNKKIRNGAYALIRKQDYAEDGDIVAAIVNGDNEATLKRFKRFNDQFVSFEPMSTDESIKSINVDLRETRVIILGKYIGKFEMNN